MRVPSDASWVSNPLLDECLIRIAEAKLLLRLLLAECFSSLQLRVLLVASRLSYLLLPECDTVAEYDTYCQLSVFLVPSPLSCLLPDKCLPCC